MKESSPALREKGSPTITVLSGKEGKSPGSSFSNQELEKKKVSFCSFRKGGEKGVASFLACSL